MSISLISLSCLNDDMCSILQHPSSSDAALVVDAVSLPLLNGSLVDFATELIGSSFRVVDNPNATGKGCGCGVSWELKA